MVIVPRVLLAVALAGHPDTAVSFHYAEGPSSVSFSDGSAPKQALLVANDLHNGWTVDTYQSVQGGGLFSNPSSRAVLIAGFALTLLLSSLALVLGTGRARAREKLELRTRELRFLALHDPLTKLPNRALILDRTEQMIARSRRTGIPCAIMFLDLDDFKDINDTLGHSVGDELLVAVSARLATVLRDGDTVGRLGGDEFVLLIEDASLSVERRWSPSASSRSCATPFEVAGYHLPLSVQASIGVAAGSGSSPEELLRDADIALYRAKAAGKGCAAVFAPSMQTAVQDQRHLYTGSSSRTRSGPVLSPLSADDRSSDERVHRSRRRSSVGATPRRASSGPMPSSRRSRGAASSSLSACGCCKKRAGREQPGWRKDIASRSRSTCRPGSSNETGSSRTYTNPFPPADSTLAS